MPGLSNWREEFNLSEVVTGKMTDKEALKKVSEKSGINNKVTINPKLDEAVKEIGGEVVGMVEADTTAQKQRLDMKQMILDRQKLKLRRKDMSAAKQEKKQGVDGDATNASKQANVIAQEETEMKEGVMKMVKKVMSKKKPEKKPEKAMDAGARAKRLLARQVHAKYVSGSEDNVPDDIRDHYEVNERTLASYLPSDRQGEAHRANLDYTKIQLKKREDESTKNRGDLKKRDAGKMAKERLRTKKIMSMGEAEDKAFNFVRNKLKAKYGDGVLTTGEKMKPPTAAQKKAAAVHREKIAKQQAAEFKKDPSQGRYPKGYSNRGSD